MEYRNALRHANPLRGFTEITEIGQNGLHSIAAPPASILSLTFYAVSGVLFSKVAEYALNGDLKRAALAAVAPVVAGVVGYGAAWFSNYCVDAARSNRAEVQAKKAPSYLNR